MAKNKMGQPPQSIPTNLLRFINYEGCGEGGLRNWIDHVVICNL